MADVDAAVRGLDGLLRNTPLPVTLVGGDVTIDNAVVNVDSIAPSDLNLDGGKNLGVNVVTMPAGSTTSAKQDTGNTSLASIDGKLPALNAGSIPVADASVAALDKNAGNTGAATLRVVTAADGPLNLAVGGVNDAKVATDVAGSVSAKLRGLVAMAAAWTRGAGTSDANTLRVVQASDGPSVTALGATNDAAVTDPTATASIIAALKGLLTLNKVSTAGGQGNKAVTTAATPLALAASTACTQVIITARVGNTKQIAYGFANTVRATAASEVGAQLQPGDSVSLKVNNLASIFIDAQVNGEGVSYTYMTD